MHEPEQEPDFDLEIEAAKLAQRDNEFRIYEIDIYPG